MRSLEQMLQPGQRIKVFYNEGNINNHIRHIRDIVDEDYIVYRIWNKTKQHWFYRIEHRHDFEYKYEKGRLS